MSQNKSEPQQVKQAFLVGYIFGLNNGIGFSKQEKDFFQLLAKENKIINLTDEIAFTKNLINEIKQMLAEMRFLNPQVTELDKPRLSRNLTDLTINQMTSYFNFKKSLIGLSQRLIDLEVRQMDEQSKILALQKFAQNLRG